MISKRLQEYYIFKLKGLHLIIEGSVITYKAHDYTIDWDAHVLLEAIQLQSHYSIKHCPQQMHLLAATRPVVEAERIQWITVMPELYKVL